MRRDARHGDFYKEKYHQQKITTYHKCTGCGKYCKPTYIDDGYIHYLVSTCCKEQTKVIRYVYEKNKGKKV